MTKIKMLDTVPVSPTGLKTVVWAKGSIQHPNDDLLKVLIDIGACEIIEDKAEKPVLETGMTVVKAKAKSARGK